tara:strand:- start:545 stop:712 length:168 start_codon:yes stop_codon:yes gene_type:complete
MNNWELSLGLYPGILLGIRSYYNGQESNGVEDHVLYLPFIELCLTIYRDGKEDNK